jgi:hypothetical protein
MYLEEDRNIGNKKTNLLHNNYINMLSIKK